MSIMSNAECNENFEINEIATNLKKFKNRRQNQIQCNICEKFFNDAYNLRIHLMQHEQRFPHECPDCGKKFRQHNKMVIHRIVHLDATIKPHKCDICGKGFRYRNYLSIHRRLHENSITTSKRYQCQFCVESFQSVHLKRVHLQVAHLKEHSEPVLNCPVALCGKRFFVRCKLLAHLRRHAERREFKCDICQRCFFERAHLKDHRAIHSNLKSFQCEYCPSKFQRKYNLNQHRKIHFKNKPYECALCAEKFRYKTDLIVHQKQNYCHLRDIET